MEDAEKVLSSPVSTNTANNPRKRNFLFLTGNKKVSLTNSRSSDCDIQVDNKNSSLEKRKIVSGPTINIDISEKIEIKLGKMRTNKEEDTLSNFEDEDNFKEDMHDSNTTKRRRLPDLKPISSTLIGMSRSNERLNESSSRNDTAEGVQSNLFTQKTSITEESLTNARKIVSQSAVISKRTKWKCKRCAFQHTSKEEVILHVRNEHTPKDSIPDDNSNKIRSDLTATLSNGGNNLETRRKSMENEEGSVKREDNTAIEAQTLLATRGAGAKAYGCEACPYTTGCKSQFINHARFHRPNNGDFKCKYCTYNVTHKHLLLQHVRVHGVFDISSENVTDAKCIVDGAQCSQNQNESPVLLFSPKVNKSNVIMRKVGMLKSTESTLANRKITEIKHCNLVKSRDISKATIHLCKQCPARFFEEKQLKTHSSFHSANFRMKCNFCTYSSVQKDHLASHLKVHNKMYQMKTRKLLTMCAKARLQHPGQQKQTVAENSPRLNSHNESIKSITSDSVIYCEKCPSKFLSGILYRQHSVYHGKQSSYKCESCNFGTDTSTELAIHKLIHAGSDIEITKGNHWMKFGVFVKNDNAVSSNTGNRAKYYKCNKCPFEFSKRDRYELHLKQHGSNQKYTCTVCDFSVNLYVNYVQHLKKHDSMTVSSIDVNNVAKTDNDDSESAKPVVQNSTQLYKCDICPFYAVDEKTVSLHKQKHEIPSKSTVSSTKEESSPVPTLSCSDCDFITSSSDLLQEHEELHTALSEVPMLFDEDNSNPDDNDEIFSGCNGDDLDISLEAGDQIQSIGYENE